MIKRMVCFIVSSVSFVFAILSASPSLEYTITPLPDSFNVIPGSIRLLNAQGQVAGVINERAAFWDKNRGIFIVPIEGKTDSTSLNDYGFVCVHQQQVGKEALVWDTNTNEIYQGPWGRPYAINNLNDVLTGNEYFYDIWNINSGMVTQIDSMSFINNNGVILNCNLGNGFSCCSINDKGNAIARKINDRFFYFQNKYYLIATGKERVGCMYLNNLDEVYSLVYLDSNKTKRAVCVWKKDQKVSFSGTLEEIPELKDYYIIDASGVNDLGEVLISTVKRNGNVKKCFILVPSK